MKPNQLIAVLIATGVALLAGRMLVTSLKPPRDTAPEFVGELPRFHLNPTTFRESSSRNRSSQSRDPANPKRRPVDGPPVVHSPVRPTSGQPVRITVDFIGRTIPKGELALEYQVVEPGKYIALEDGAFKIQWLSVPMNDRGVNGDAAAGDSVFSSELPSAVQKHRRLVRYRIRTGAMKILAPPEGDTQPNFAYFVYDGLPPWKGAIDPKSRNSTLRRLVTYQREALEKVPVYHFISSKSAVENVTWKERGHFGGRNRNEYVYTGTMVYDGIVYDHVGFRARGGGWRHAMGKNMWKFNFLPGHRFEARDHYGKRYDAKWDKLNLGACIQQGDYGMRGEQGMFEAVGFRLFNLAGTEASRTHWVHLRIIDEAEEAPADQYAGDFWGLYLAVENVDDHFLKEHHLPKGNVYKMEFGAKTAYNGNPAISDQSDVNAFLRAISRRQQPDSWWSENVDLARYYNYRAILECIHHYDIDSGKNYFFYLNPEPAKWVVIPWDIDLSWGDQMFGGGHEPFLRAQVLSRPPFRHQYQERLAEIRDLLFNPEQIGKLIDEHAAMISDPRGGPSLVDADRAKWDYNQVLDSSYVMDSKAGRGRFYFGNPRNSFQTMVTYMKGYATKRSKWIDARLLAGYRPPAPRKIAGPDKADLAATSLRFQLTSPPADPDRNCRWRLADVTQAGDPGFDPGQPWKYEIEALWEESASPSEPVAIPTKLLAAGHSYRVRAKWQDAAGTWSRWSSPVQFTVSGP